MVKFLKLNLYARADCIELGVDGELAALNPRNGQRKVFKFDKIFDPASTQEEVYEDTKPLIRSVLDGMIFLRICFGQVHYVLWLLPVAKVVLGFRLSCSLAQSWAKPKMGILMAMSVLD